MKIIFNELKLHNFLSFEDAEIRLDNPGYMLIQGVNNNPVDLAASNGSGKSALLEAISWAITGETIRGSKDVARIDSDKKCCVNLKFSVDDNKYEIVRQLNPSKLNLFYNGEDISGKGIRDTTKILEEYLPDLTSSLLGSVVILGQGLPQRFTNNTPSGRKDVLEKLSKSDFMIDDLKTRISKRKKELDEAIRICEDNNLKYTTMKSMLAKNIVDFNQRLSNLPSIEEESKKLDNVKLLIKDIEDRIRELNDKINILTKEQLDISNKKADLNASLLKKSDSISSLYSIELSDLFKKQASIESKIKTLSNEIYKIKNIKDVCPTCGQKIPGIIKPDTSDLEKEKEENNQYLSEINTKIKDLEEEKNNKLRLVREENESSLRSIDNDLKNNVEELRICKCSLDIDNKSLYENKVIESKINNIITTRESTEKELISNIKDSETKISEIDSKILYNNKDKDDLQERLTFVQKMNTVVTRDFRGYLLKSVIGFINRKSKEYSQKVFESDKIDFILDGNNISISYDNKEYENLSGGEKQKVDLIVQFAIRDMLCKYLNFSSNIIAVDELFDNLDSIGCEKVLNLISNINDVETIYIITHHSSIPIPFDRIITVTKGVDGVSRIDAVY